LKPAAASRIGIALVLLTVLYGGAMTTARAAGQTLTVHARLCPDGYTGADYAVACATPIVGAGFRIGAPPDRRTDASGTVDFDISGATPGIVGFVQDAIDAKYGSRVSCVSDGVTLGIRFLDGLSSWPIIQFMVPSAASVTCNLYYSNDPAFGASAPVSGDPFVAQTVFALACDADPGVMPSLGSVQFPPAGCQLEPDVAMSATTGDAVALGSCETGADGTCVLLLPVQDQVILREENGSIPAGYRPIANPVLLRATQAPSGIVNIRAGSADRPSGPASLTVHSRVCPAGYAGSDFDHECHAIAPDYAQTIFLIGQNGGVDATSAKIDPAGNVVFAALAEERYTLIPALPSTIAATHVFCSKDASPGVEYPSTTTFTAVAVSKTEIDLSQGDAITCDFFAIPATA
jgi:hypothetical protein